MTGLVATPSLAQALPPVVEWHNAYDGGGWEWFQSVAQTADGGYVGVGDRYVVKVDAFSSIEWAIATNAQLRAIKVLADGSYILVGYLGNNGYVAKYAFDGALLWEYQYIKGSRSSASSVQPTRDGGFIVSGYARSTTTLEDIWLLKLDANGLKTWEKIFGGAKAEYSGETDQSLQQTSDGGYVIVGTNFSVLPVNTADITVLRTDAFGNLKWQKNYGGSRFDIGYSIQQTRDSGFIVTGSYDYASSTDTDAYLLKLDGLGNVQWQKFFGGPLADRGISVLQTSDGGYIMGGMYSFSSTDWDFYLVKTDSQGNLTWQNVYGGALGDLAYTLQPTADGGYIFGGYTESFAQSNRDFYLIKLSTAGALTGTGLAAPSPLQARPLPPMQQRLPR